MDCEEILVKEVERVKGLLEGNSELAGHFSYMTKEQKDFVEKQFGEDYSCLTKPNVARLPHTSRAYSLTVRKK